MTRNLQEQIQEMQLEFAKDDISLEELIEKLNKIVYQRGYLSVQIDKAQVNNANQIISEFDILTSKLSELQNSITDKESFLKELKPPALFGKAKYQDTVDTKNKEINELKANLEKLKNDIDSKRGSVQNAKQLIKKQIEENSIIENQYIQDEKLFLNEKTNIKSGLAKNYCSLPEEVINGDWEIISSYFKNYFRKSSDKVFPIIGWEYAFGHALILSSYYNNWKEINDAIIVYGESVELASVMALFLCRYIKYVENHSNPLHYFVKALVLFIQILRLKDAEDIFSLMRTCQGEKISEMAILVSYPTFRFKVLELFEALREAKDIAIKQNDEKILNFIITEENKYNNIFGWVKKYPQNNS